jgi:hypothetical protein
MTWPRLLGLALAALVTTSVALIAAHNLWEHSASSHTRERVVLFNAVTALTIAIGVLTLYLALLAFSVVGSFSLIPERALYAQIHWAAAVDYLRVGRMATSLATLAGALGSLVESDLAVREAAYGYRPSQEAGDDGTAAPAAWSGPGREDHGIGAADRAGQLVGADTLQVADDRLAAVGAELIDVSRIADHAANAVAARDERAGEPPSDLAVGSDDDNIHAIRPQPARSPAGGEALTLRGRARRPRR